MKRKKYSEGAFTNKIEGRIPPQDTAVEAALLGSIIYDQDKYLNIQSKIHEDMFYNDAHRKIFIIIRDMIDGDRDIDTLTVVSAASSKGILEEIGGAYAIANISSNASAISPVEDYCDILQSLYTKREIIKIGYRAMEEGYDSSLSIEECVEDIENKLYALKNPDRNEDENAADIMYKAKKEIEKAYLLRQKGELPGISTGFNQLDSATGGWQSPDLIILAGRPSMGKTAFVISTARFMAYRMNRKIDFYSLEMSSVQLMTRVISAETDINAFDLKNGNIRDTDFVTINTKMGGMNNNLFIDDSPGLSIQSFKAKARKRKKEHGTDLIVIDYLQLMTVGNAKMHSREQEISFISRQLKIVAKSLNVPIIALSQLSRSVDSRPDKRPVMSDLRESGAIEQDADIIGFLFRPEYYGIFEDEKGNNLQGKAQLLIRKNRNGPIEDIYMDFIKEKAEFVNQGTIDSRTPF